MVVRKPNQFVMSYTLLELVVNVMNVMVRSETRERDSFYVDRDLHNFITSSVIEFIGHNR